MPASLRILVLRLCGLHLGAGVAVASGTIFKGCRVTIGGGSFINHRVFVDRGQLTLGKNVFVGPGVIFATRNHRLGGTDQRAGENIDQPVKVGDGTWIGAGAMILGGVEVARGCVIAAGAVVTRDTLPDGVYAGVPAVRVKDLPE